MKNAEKIKLELECNRKTTKETLARSFIEAKKTVATAQEQAKSYIEAQKEEARKQAEEIIEKLKFNGIGKTKSFKRCS